MNQNVVLAGLLGLVAYLWLGMDDSSKGKGGDDGGEDPGERRRLQRYKETYTRAPPKPEQPSNHARLEEPVQVAAPVQPNPPIQKLPPQESTVKPTGFVPLERNETGDIWPTFDE